MAQKIYEVTLYREITPYDRWDVGTWQGEAPSREGAEERARECYGCVGDADVGAYITDWGYTPRFDS